MHLRLWPAALAFLITIFLHARGRQLVHSPVVRGLALAAFVSVCFQATLGGLRVTQETAGALDSALVLRILHGVFAQTFLCVNVALATMLASAWQTQTISNDEKAARALRKWAWLAFAAVYLQLIVGAAMRHLGAGLAISTFPEASPDGSWLPAVHNAFVDLNFMHTRVGAIVVICLVLLAAGYAVRRMCYIPGITRPAWTLIGLVLIQSALGMFVIWHLKPRTLTTFHVLNGAALLAVTLLLALRASNAVRSTRGLQPVTSL